MSDLISRQAAIHLADELKDNLPDDMHLANMTVAHNEAILDYQTQISLLPSAEKTGHWILSIEDWNKWTCSVCGYSKRTDIHVSLGYDYCPKCGAKMVEPQESEDKE